MRTFFATLRRRFIAVLAVSIALQGVIFVAPTAFAAGDGTVDSTAEINGSTANGPVLANVDFYGAAVAGIGDLDNDGVEDIAVGAYQDNTGGSFRGTVHIHFLNTNGSLDSTVEINSGTTNGPALANSDNYGFSVAGIGDLNNDGVEDIAVGAPLDDTGGSNRGAIYIHFMNSNGSIVSTVKIAHGTSGGPTLANDDSYGSSIANIGDLDNDGVSDLLVGAYQDDTGGLSRGAAYIHYMNTNGTIDSTVKIASGTTNGPSLADSDNYGASVASIGDLDGDSVEDIAVAAHQDDAGGTNRGAVHIHFMNTNGTIDSTVEINDTTTNGPVLTDSDRYGFGMAGIGDFDGDGVEDIAVGAYLDDQGGSDRGALHISFLNTDGSVDSTVEINSSTTNGPVLANFDDYGRSVASLGDINNDSVVDLAVGAYLDDNGNLNQGAVHIHLMHNAVSGADLSLTKTVDDPTPGVGNSVAYTVTVSNAGPASATSVVVKDLLPAGVTYASSTPSQGSYVSGTGMWTVGTVASGGNANIVINATVNSGTEGTTISNVAEVFSVNETDLDSTPGNNSTTEDDDASADIGVATNDPTLDNVVTASRLKAGASSTYNFGFTLQNTITGTLTITFPAGFTVTAAATSGACTGGTVGTFGFTAQTLTAVKTGCAAGALTLSGATVTNHSTPGAYTISWVNDDPGEAIIYIIDDDQVMVTGNVDPTLTFNAGMQDDATACDGTFSGNGGTLALGVLTTGAVTTSDASSVDHICTRLSTNASGGASVTVRSLNGTDGLKSTSVPTDTIPSSTATLVAGTAGYGLCTGSAGGDSGNDAISGSSSPTRSAPFNTTCTNAAHNVGGLTTSAQNLWTLSGPSQNAFVRTYVKAAISGTTSAHADYADTLTFIGTGTF